MDTKILVATNNKHKRQKLTEIVDNYFSRIDCPEDIKLNVEVDENGASFLANAGIKAREYSKYYEGYTICTDGGVLIPTLKDRWNPLYTKRFASENATDIDRINLLLDMMRDKQGEDRLMIWVEALAIGYRGKVIFKTQAKGVNGYLQTRFDPRQYREGIWVCSVWYFPQFQKNFFDLNEIETKKIEVHWDKLKNKTQNFIKKI